MLRCQDVAELMSDYLDGALGWRRHLSIRLHLMICALCRRYARQMRATVALLRTLADRPGDATDHRDA